MQIVKKGRAMWRALQKCFKDTLEPCVGAHTYPCFLSPLSYSLYLFKNKAAFMILVSAFLPTKMKHGGDFSQKKCPFGIFLSVPPTSSKSLWDQLIN